MFLNVYHVAVQHSQLQYILTVYNNPFDRIAQECNELNNSDLFDTGKSFVCLKPMFFKHSMYVLLYIKLALSCSIVYVNDLLFVITNILYYY